MTLNCLILFHVSPLTDAYQLREDSQAEEDADAVNERDRVEELAALRDYVVVSANELAGRLPRDEAGYLAAEAYPREDIADRARLEMARLGEQYDRLGGYYPRPKPFFFSEFFSQQYMMGYYFPFSMEANYNERMYVVNMPLVMCHELSHLKGFIYEDEANFLGFLACVDSEEELFRYSAYLSVIDYLDRDLYEALGSDPEAYRRHPAIGELVRQDNIFLTPTAWEQVEAGAVLPTALVKEVSGEFVEANLTINGVADGTVSYSRVVELLLWYYEGEPPVY